MHIYTRTVYEITLVACLSVSRTHTGANVDICTRKLRNVFIRHLFHTRPHKNSPLAEYIETRITHPGQEMKLRENARKPTMAIKLRDEPASI